jgi:predicted lipoprotein with Yx(FWY)xxD motif
MGRTRVRTLTVLAGIGVALAVSAPIAAAPTATTAAPTITVHGSNYGRILFDGRGFVLYAFTADSRARSNCAGACAKAWPPYIIKRVGTAGKGTRSSLLGTTRRKDGSLQLTYAGHPLYYYEGDRKPGQILCQDVSEFGGLWLVVRPGGALVR